MVNLPWHTWACMQLRKQSGFNVGRFDINVGEGAGSKRSHDFLNSAGFLSNAQYGFLIETMWYMHIHASQHACNILSLWILSGSQSMELSCFSLAAFAWWPLIVEAGALLHEELHGDQSSTHWGWATILLLQVTEWHLGCLEAPCMIMHALDWGQLLHACCFPTKGHIDLPLGHECPRHLHSWTATTKSTIWLL